MSRHRLFRQDTAPFYKGVVVVSSVDDVPTQLSKEVYIVSRGGSDRWAMLTCPCGCGERLDVNLTRARWPHWRLRRHDGTISISPSLWVSEERCGSHFW